MKVTVLGANGKIGRLLLPKLIAAGHDVRALVRDRAQAPAVENIGAHPVVGDLEGIFTPAIEGAEAVIFTAGSGGKTGGDKTLLVDLWGARKAVDCAKAAGARRFLMVSARRTEDPDAAPPGIRHYLVAKKIADEYLAASGLDFTIVKPGPLTDEPATGSVSLAPRITPEIDSITREDVADVLVACLGEPKTIGTALELLNGPDTIAASLARLG